MRSKAPLVILGTGGNALDLLDALGDLEHSTQGSPYAVAGLLDDRAELHGQRVRSLAVLGPLTHARELDDCCFLCCVGSPKNFWRKREILEALGLPEERFATVVHPSAYVSPSASVGPGCIVLQQVTLNSEVRLGSHVLVLPQTVISHDAAIGSWSSVASAACLAGGVAVGPSCYLGANCSINSGVRVGERSLVGMGAVVLRDIPQNSVYVGNPARFLRHTT